MNQEQVIAILLATGVPFHVIRSLIQCGRIQHGMTYFEAMIVNMAYRKGLREASARRQANASTQQQNRMLEARPAPFPSAPCAFVMRANNGHKSTSYKTRLVVLFLYTNILIVPNTCSSWIFGVRLASAL